jgi:hypothetical protein
LAENYTFTGVGWGWLDQMEIRLTQPSSYARLEACAEFGNYEHNSFISVSIKVHKICLSLELKLV